MSEGDILPEGLPDDPQTLKALLRSALEENRKLRQRNEGLLHALLQLRRMHFGPRSERVAPGQLLFPFAGELQTEPETPIRRSRPETCAKPRKASPHGRRLLPPELPRVRQVHDLPQDEKTCDDCGGELEPKGR